MSSLFTAGSSPLLITNRSLEDLTVELAWCLGADFADLMEALEGSPSEKSPTEVLDHGIRYRHDHPELAWWTDVEATGAGEWMACPDRLACRVNLPSQRPQQIRLTITAHDVEPLPDAGGEAERRRAADQWREAATRIHVPGHRLVERTASQAVSDLVSFALLEGTRDEWLAPSAGMPLYPALFGRDSLTTCWQAALLDRGRLLKASMTRLQRLQGVRDDPARDEQPGRIIHSLRRGRLARTGANPYAQYFGDYASPLMFVVSLAHLYAWTGEQANLERHWDAARRALDWARDAGDRDGGDPVLPQAGTEAAAF